jgi:two-component system KDP operon response regulator KdpE
MSAPLVLLIEDEQAIRRFLRTSLAEQSYRLVEAESGGQGLRLAAQQPPDLVILDLPIIVLSARDQEKQKIEALDHGADDYLTKPFSTGELLARLRVALRHATAGNAEKNASTFALGDLKVDLAARRVHVGDQEIHLTPLEYKLLTTLIRHAGKVLTHRFLLKEVWGPLHSQDTHYLRVFMAALRRKLEADSTQPRYLLTEPAVGYRLAMDQS